MVEIAFPPARRVDSAPPTPPPHGPALRGAERRPLWREQVGEVLRTERREQGRILTEVAETAGVSPQYLSEIERGRKEPSSEILGSVAGALGLGLGDVAARVAARLAPREFAAPVLDLGPAIERRSVHEFAAAPDRGRAPAERGGSPGVLSDGAVLLLVA
jgi:transcriptional regulator with XRE-family HTH domain